MTRFAPRRPSWSTAALTLAFVPALGVGAIQGREWQAAHELEQARTAATAAARVEVERLITISGPDASDDVADLLAGATAQFRDDLQDRADQLRKALSANKVTTTGEVVSTGVVKATTDRATVLVAAVGTVRNKTSDEDQPRSYRLSVTLQKADDRWLVSGLEFVA